MRFYDGEGTEFATLYKSDELLKLDFSAYADTALKEAINVISNKNDITGEQAEKMLYSGGYSIYTYFDKDLNASLQKTADAHKDFEIGGAITDNNGKLLAVLSSMIENDLNYATSKNIPCSSFKPLSVYAQAIESGKVNFSSIYEDSPYKKIKDSNGNEVNWPVNSDGKYSYSSVTVSEAIKKSLNTIAVKCLKDVGVKNSLNFLTSELNIPLSYEKQTLLLSGEDEVIGNIGLGYISSGVSAVDMAGYYQIFANGGFYTEPKSISKIVDLNGKVIYEREEPEKNKIISYPTSDLMNKLLQGVVSASGTGFEAAVKGVEIAGKTGTDEDFKNHWFVGVTPEYSCAIWHSSSAKIKNNAPLLFSEAIEDIYANNSNLKTKFELHCNIKTMVYCTETGDLASLSCSSIEKGYYYGSNVPSTCKGH